MTKFKEKHWLKIILVVHIYFCFILEQVNAQNETIGTSQPIPTWKESWDSHIENLSVHSLNEHVAFFSAFHGNATLQTNELLIVSVPNSLAWKFSSKLINSTASAGSLGIYVLMSHQQFKNIVHEDEMKFSQSCLLSNDSVPSSKCYLIDIQSKNDPSEILESDIHEEVQAVANLIIGSSLEETNLVSGWRVHDILLYDRLVQSGKTNTANKLKIQLLDKKSIYPERNLTLFSDWFLSIYEHHGGFETVAKFLNISQLAFLNISSNSTEAKVISCGQFIHLWSQAAETDLRDLAYKVFGWAHWNEYIKQFQEARANTHVLNYQDVYPNASLYEPPLHWMGHYEDHTENLSLVFKDEHVAMYYGPSMGRNPTWPFKLGSDLWSYAKQTYDLDRLDPLLYVLVRTGNVELVKYSGSSPFLRKEYHNRLVYDLTLTGESASLRQNLKEIEIVKETICYGEIITTLILESLNWYNMVTRTFSYIVSYDLVVGTGNDAIAAHYKTIIISLKRNWPRASTFPFRDWFYPIYSRHGGKAVLKKVFGLLKKHLDRKDAHLEPLVTLGELVHWWSGAAGEDLTKLAIQAFGWSSTDSEDLAQAQVKYPQLNYTHVSSELLHDWKEHWAGHDQDLTLVYSDEHVAFYTETEVNSTTNVSRYFHLMSAGWKYAKETYGSISDDPLLFVVLHQRDSACIWSRMEQYLDRDYENRNVIDCGGLQNDKNNPQNSKLEDILMAALGRLILSGAKKAGNWPGAKVSDTSMASIVVYDILMGISYVDHGQRFLARELSAGDTALQGTINWFRDWYYPIYTKHGQAHAITSFFEILQTNWPQVDQDYTKQLDLGTWVHFWSAAVGENLWYEAAEFLDWGILNHRLYLKARDAHPLIHIGASDLKIPTEDWTRFWENSEENLSLVYVDSHVAVYFDSLMDPTITWPFKLLSDAWRHIKKIYGSFSPDPILYVVLHNGQHVKDYYNCKYLREYRPSFALEDRTLLECDPKGHTWDSLKRGDTFVFILAVLVSEHAKQAVDNIDFAVSSLNIVAMIAFDINIALGRNEDAVNVFQIEQKFGVGSYITNIWWRNWFFPIYIKYGRASVIDKFFTLLKEHFPRRNAHEFARSLNTGEFLHFWSGAAGVSLKRFSRHILNWTATYEKEYTKAVQDFPVVTYTDSDDTKNDDPQPLAHFENQFKHTEFLYQAYADSQVEVYLDLDVSLQANWTFTFLSKSWQYTTLVYEILQSTPKNPLDIFIHSKKHEGCRRSATNNTFTIDCGSISSEAWALDSPENREIFLNQYVNLIQESSEQVAEKGSIAFTLFKNMHKFDIYLRLGMFREAYVLLSKALTQSSAKSGEPVFYVRDWLLPIYTRNGGVSVFNRFLLLVVEHWNSKRNHYKKPLNVGQSLHFWSSAADENLFFLSQATYGRNSLYEAQFIEARKDFILPRYACYDCHVAPWALNNSKNDDLAIGFSIGLTCIFITSICALVCLYRRKVQSLKHQIRELTADEIDEFFQGNSNAEEQDGRNGSVEAQPFNTEFEIPRDQLDIHTDYVLGSGEFGLVLRGILKAAPGSSEETTVVAVKTVKPNVDVTYFKAFLTELKVMCFLGKHGNIVSLLGAITVNIKNREVFVALELCPHGDLLQFLKNGRSSFKDLIRGAGRNTIKTQVFKCEEPSTPALAKVDYVNTPNYINDCNSIEISSLTLLEWSCQVAQGMAYIASKNVIHGDLAARNVLLTSDRIAKISDFGLSRQLVNYSTYMKKSRTPVPWRWMAIESLREMNFSVQSDVWAYGVTLYEIFSLGMTPYAGWTWDYDFVDKLAAGHRLSSPEFGNNEIYQIMMECMKGEAKERINYAEIIKKLQRIKETLSIPQIENLEV